MQFKRQSKSEEGVNLTPLIDVVFLLLIFFMVSTTFTKESHLTIDLPEAVGVSQSAAADFIEVLVDADGNYSVNGKTLINKQVETLRSAIDGLSAGNNKLPFIITGDQSSSYQAIISVMDLAGQMGFTNLSLTTKTPGEGAD